MLRNGRYRSFCDSRDRQGTAMHDHFPMTVGSLLRESVDVYVRNWRPLTIMSLVALPSLAILLGLVPLLVLFWMFFTLPAVGWYPTRQEVVIGLGLVAVILVVGMLPYNLARATVVMAVSQYYVEGSIAIRQCFTLALRSVVSLTLSGIAVGSVVVLVFFGCGFVIAYPFADAFAVPLNSLFGDRFWFEFGWTIPFWLSLPSTVLISWLFFVEGRMFTQEYSGNWGRPAGPDGSGGAGRTGLRMRTLAMGSVYTCVTVAVRSSVIIGSVVFYDFMVVLVWGPAYISALHLLFIGLLVPSVAALVVVTPIAWIGRTLAYFDLMKGRYGGEPELIRDDGGAFRWATRRRSE